MASCVRNIRTKNYYNLIIPLQVTIDNVGDPFLTQCILCINLMAVLLGSGIVDLATSRWSRIFGLAYHCVKVTHDHLCVWYRLYGTSLDSFDSKVIVICPCADWMQQLADTDTECVNVRDVHVCRLHCGAEVWWWTMFECYIIATTAHNMLLRMYRLAVIVHGMHAPWNAYTKIIADRTLIVQHPIWW